MTKKPIFLFLLMIMMQLCEAQKVDDKDLINSLLSSRNNYSFLLPVFDSSLCIIRQEYTLIDSNGKEFGANGKLFWGIKYGLGVITDKGVYSLGNILLPWADDKDLKDLEKTDPRHLLPHLSTRLYKRPMDKSFMQWKNVGSNAQTPDAAPQAKTSNSMTTLAQESQSKDKRGKNKRLPVDTIVALTHPVDSVGGKSSKENNAFLSVENFRIFQDSTLVSFTISDSIPTIPSAVNTMDTTGWLVLVSNKYIGEINDTSQLAYTIIRPSYTNNRSKMYIREPAGKKQNLLGGIYYTAHFSCGKISFSAAGLLNRDEKGWFINAFTLKRNEVFTKPTATEITPIK